MKNLRFLVFIFSTTFCYSQSLEDNIYAATESFYSQPDTQGFETLNSDIIKFEPQLKTEDEYFAFINLIVIKAYYLSEQNKQRQAISAYEKAYQIYIKNSVLSYDIIEYCLIPLGVLYHKSNAYLKAENIIKHYIVLAEKQGNTTQQVTGNINLAKLYQSLNKHQSALVIVNRTKQIKDIKPNQKKRLNSIKQRSELLIKTNQKKLLLDDDIIFNLKNNPEELKLKYQLALENENYKEALKYYNRFKNITLKNKLITRREYAKLSFQESQLLYLLERPNEASKELSKTLKTLLPTWDTNQYPTKNDLYPENLFIDIFDLFAALATNPEQKLKYYDISFYVVSLLDEETTIEESLIIKASTKRNRSEKCITILYNLYLKEKDTLYLQRAINYAEQNKVSVLKNNFQKRRLFKKNSLDSILIEENSLVKEQKRLTNKLLNRPVNQTQAKKQDSLRLQLVNVSARLKSLQSEINKNYLNNSLITLNSIQSKLNDNKAIVEYFYGKNAIFQFVFSENDYQFNRLLIDTSVNQKIIEFIRYFNDAAFINSDITSYTNDAFSIYKLLNFEAVDTKSKVIIIPDGMINFIPFEALLSSKTSSLSFDKMPFVINNQTLSYNSSLEFYLNSKSERIEDKILGVFPVFKNSGRELLYTIDEAKGIEKHIQGEFLLHDQATKENFLKQINDYSILHLSTHATSGNFINPANISFSKSTLSLDELYTIDINPNLIVLSACETGVGKLFKGETPLSIARGFQYAGAENILFSQWQINDLSTSTLMTSFYSYYSKGKSAMFANRQSKIDYLNNSEISNAKKSPYYWSAFIFYGDSQELNQTKSTFILWFLCIIALLIIVFLAYKFKSKNA